VDAYLERLAPRRREAFILRHALEYTVEEIAELTGAPPGTVKDRLVNARKQLRRMLDREERNVSEDKGS
jgi:RNA polymerase sigma-70 factor (ECF subfamily)